MPGAEHTENLGELGGGLRRHHGRGIAGWPTPDKATGRPGVYTSGLKFWRLTNNFRIAAARQRFRNRLASPRGVPFYGHGLWYRRRRRCQPFALRLRIPHPARQPHLGNTAQLLKKLGRGQKYFVVRLWWRLGQTSASGEPATLCSLGPEIPAGDLDRPRKLRCLPGPRARRPPGGLYRRGPRIYGGHGGVTLRYEKVTAYKYGRPRPVYANLSKSGLAG